MTVRQKQGWILVVIGVIASMAAFVLTQHPGVQLPFLVLLEAGGTAVTIGGMIWTTAPENRTA